ncbi:MAG: hypothetical protein ACODAE_02955 [Gemmatimonadota bacterium]
MPGKVVTTASTVLCQHGAPAQLQTSNTKAYGDGSPALLESDIHPVSGCPFTLPNGKSSPCVRIEWAPAGTPVSVQGTPVVVESTVGQCINAEGVPQGVATILPPATKASTR